MNSRIISKKNQCQITSSEVFTDYYSADSKHKHDCNLYLTCSASRSFLLSDITQKMASEAALTKAEAKRKRGRGQINKDETNGQVEQVIRDKETDIVDSVNISDDDEEGDDSSDEEDSDSSVYSELNEGIHNMVNYTGFVKVNYRIYLKLNENDK